MGEAGGVDGALVGVDHQTGQTFYTALIPGQIKTTNKSPTCATQPMINIFVFCFGKIYNRAKYKVY